MNQVVVAVDRAFLVKLLDLFLRVSQLTEDLLVGRTPGKVPTLCPDCS